MRKSKYDAIIKRLTQRAVFTAHEAHEAGIPPRMLAHFCKKGLIERISRGIYKGGAAPIDIDFQWEDLFLVAMSIPHGVICLISALSYYGLTDQIMREFWIAVPHALKSPKRPKTRIIRMRNIDLGQTEITVGKDRLKMFDRERTVVDAFRHLSHEIAIKALQEYLKQRESKPNLNKLLKYAKKLRVNIYPYVMALTT
ncbi:MAG: type IV toxin-antitoxin system AbiEi family antitoxin domain-containing protein [Verrucomicrobia bacterium]|nr:type IV toxin-antitoxin system AbiEi family antitoxin domain-containing protein [Verrucomicrobiota bacterium]